VPEILRFGEGTLLTEDELVLALRRIRKHPRGRNRAYKLRVSGRNFVMLATPPCPRERSRRAWPTTTPAGGRNWCAGSWIGGALGGWLRSRRCDRRLRLPGAGIL